MKPNAIESTAAQREAGDGTGSRGTARAISATLGTLAAMYVAFAVGAPWLLRDAPPDSYAVVATEAACVAPADASACRETFVR